MTTATTTSTATLTAALQSMLDYLADTGAKLIVCCGVGVDSVAMLVGLHALGIVPDLIVFADVGAEKPETYGYIAKLNAWLREQRWPELTVVRKPDSARHQALDDACLANETPPSLATGGHSCSLRWKVETIDRHLNGVSRGADKFEGWLPKAQRHAGTYSTPVLNDDGTPQLTKAGNPRRKKHHHETQLKAVKLIGYDAGTADIRRANKGRREDHQFRYAYPLQEWGWEREQCVREIEAAGLPVPVKSACYMCPASHRWELMWLAARHPELFAKALLIEDTARDGRHGFKTIKGLGRNWSWREWAEGESIVAAGGYDVITDAAELLARAEALKPSYEANDCRTLPCDFGDRCDGDGELVQIGRVSA